jgi:YD repeat-containing protein
VDLDAAGRLQRVRGFSGAGLDVEYDRRGYLKSIQDLSGDVLTVQRDPHGQVVALYAGRKLRHRFRYEADGTTVSAVDFVDGDHAARIAFGDGRPRAVKWFDGAETRLTRGAGSGRPDRIDAIRAANGAVVDFEYDPKGRLLSVALKGGYQDAFTYDDEGRLTGISRTRKSGER